MSILITASLLIFGAGAGFAADALGLPLPFLLGPLLVSGATAIFMASILPENYSFPQRLRTGFIAIIGLMIGAQVTADMFTQPARLGLAVGALALFVVLCFGLNYWLFRRIGRYDRPTAFYSSSPGGLYESLAMGEAAGADLARLTLQQFLRIILVVSVLPIALSIWLGEPVGSAAGMTLAVDHVHWTALPGLVVAAGLGLVLGRLLRLPAGQLTGPLAVAALLTLSGAWPVETPDWLVKLAQVVVGTALGMRFSGISRAMILQGAGLALLSVGGMLGISVIFALALVPVMNLPFDVMMISFAPGGVTEMALVALSLNANPAFVTLHHIIRILLTVLGLVLTAKIKRSALNL